MERKSIGRRTVLKGGAAVVAYSAALHLIWRRDAIRHWLMRLHQEFRSKFKLQLSASAQLSPQISITTMLKKQSSPFFSRAFIATSGQCCR